MKRSPAIDAAGSTDAPAHLRRRLALRVVSLLPVGLFAILLILGFFRADIVSYTQSDPKKPQWQVALGSSAARQMLSIRTPEINRHWPAMPAWQHLSVVPDPLKINPDTELFHFLGLRELHVLAMDEHTAYNELLIPSWLTAFLLALPAMVVWGVNCDGSITQFFLRVCWRELVLTSTVLSILLALLWIRSYHSLDILHVQYPDKGWNFSVVCGEISFQSQPIPSPRAFAFWIHNPGYHPNGLIHNVISRLHATEKTERRFFDFQYANLRELELMGSGRTWSVAVPIWFFVYLLAAPAVWVLRGQFVRWKDRQRGNAVAEEPNLPSKRKGRIKT